MKVVMAPKLSADLNPYQDLLQRGIEEADPDITCIGWKGLSLRWLVEGRRDIGVIHLHWLEHLYVFSNTFRTYRRFTVMLLALVFAKLTRVAIIYTVHNLTQHGSAYPSLNRLGNKLIFRLADAVHVHDESGRQAVALASGRKDKVFVIPHGSYIGAYPNNLTKGEARNLLCMPGNCFIYMCFGQVRPNKGLETVVNAFGEVESPQGRLVIAGWAPDASYGESIRSLAMNDPRVAVHLRLVPVDEIQLYLNACDVCVLPYRTVTTSGAALLAFSFGRPIIAPNIGCFPELIGDSRGILYDPEQPGSLTLALESAQDLDIHEASREAFSFAKRLNWKWIGRQHVDVYLNMSGAHKRKGLPDYQSRR